MERREGTVCCSMALFFLWVSAANSLLSPNGVNYEVQALMGIKGLLKDPHEVLNNWDKYAADPCSWAMVTCSVDGFVISLGIPSQNLSGMLSPSIGNLTNLQNLLLQNNNIAGPLPAELWRLQNLRTIDLSNNLFTGHLSDSLSHMSNLEYLRLSNNNLSGVIPSTMNDMSQIAFLDLSYNNFSGPVPRLNVKTLNIVGNPLICATGSEPDCFRITQTTHSLNSSQCQCSLSFAGNST